MVAESDGAVELHQGDVTVQGGVVVPRMDDDLGHGALHLVLVSSILALPSEVDDPGAGDVSGGRTTNGICLCIISGQFTDCSGNLAVELPYIWRQ